MSSESSSTGKIRYKQRSDDFKRIDDEEHPPVVIDVGSLLTKAGWAGDDAPRTIFPTLDPVLQRHKAKAKATSEESVVVHPIERGYITTQWESMEDVWHHTFYKELQADPHAQAVLLTEPPMNPKAARERTVQILFDNLGVPALYLSVAPVMALYASGRTTGCVVDSGDGVTHIVPVYEGYCLPNAVVRIDTAGSDVTAHLEELLMKRWGIVVDLSTLDCSCRSTTSTSDLLLNLKKTRCYVATDFQAEMAKPEEELEQPVEFFPVEGSDPTIVQWIGRERFLCTERLFQPKRRNGSSNNKASVEVVEPPPDDKNTDSSLPWGATIRDKGIVEATYQSMVAASQGCEIFNVLCANVLLTGGNTLFPGFEERFSKDLRALVPPRVAVNVVAPETRQFDVWRGGSIISSLSTFGGSMWLTREQYMENGPQSIHQKFF